MKMIIGGGDQGKLHIALAMDGLTPEDVCDGAYCDLTDIPRKPILYRLHLLVRRLMEAGRLPYEPIARMVRENPEVIIVTDEIGCGIVPADRFEREWREATGRICCELAQSSERVERVVAGIATVIKGA